MSASGKCNNGKDSIGKSLSQTWEKAYKLNVGVDLAMFNNRLKFTADYYNDKYFDLLQNRGKSIELIGQYYPMENIGKVRRFGGEFVYYLSRSCK